MTLILFHGAPEAAAQLIWDGAHEKIDLMLVEDLAALTSHLYRRPEAMGVIHSNAFEGARYVRDARLAEVRNLMMVLLTQASQGSIVAALTCGADDVQPWPITSREFLARIDALARRERRDDESAIHFAGDCVFDVNRATVRSPAGTTLLTKMEADLLWFVCQRSNGGGVATRESCIDFLYQGRDEAEVNILDVFICKVRKKLFALTGGLDVIETVWGRGYRFNAEGSRPIFDERRARAPA